MNIIDTITAWPVIVQGALGSALFAITSFLGQKIVRFFFSKWEKYSRTNNEVLASQKVALIGAYIDNDRNELSNVLTLMMFSSFHYIMKAVLFVAFGLVAESLLPAFGLAGYFIGFIYLFKAMTYSPHLAFLDNHTEEELKEIKEQLAAEVNN
ncbi:hypothetical protein MTR11_23440 [Vibrio sp. CCB-PB317]|uniref:hypothetical protein n=1 Tax=Vibrio sp. CCB-PB317 TaxID=2929171 RepID=UPI001FAB3C14|nr:hypothetical protein [Vibrio sp. CCB-PB317]MCJ0884620.1 hypothetical protein [Vibrio sp. CCB-PB317]